MEEKKPVRFCVAVDGSDNSFRALEWAVKKFSAQRQDKLALLYVQPKSTALETLMDPFDVLHVTNKQLREFAESRLERFEKFCAEHKVNYERRIVITDRDPKEDICEEVQFFGADFLVVGARGVGQLQRLLLGSTSEYCVNHCLCTVVVVR
ncbi:hypothetical protein QOT17_014006 [Balamuthia mandrillaris]